MRRLSIVPISGTTKMDALEENTGAAAIELSAEELQESNTAAAKIAPQGALYPQEPQRQVGR